GAGLMNKAQGWGPPIPRLVKVLERRQELQEQPGAAPPFIFGVSQRHEVAGIDSDDRIGLTPPNVAHLELIVLPARPVSDDRAKVQILRQNRLLRIRGQAV